MLRLLCHGTIVMYCLQLWCSATVGEDVVKGFVYARVGSSRDARSPHLAEKQAALPHKKQALLHPAKLTKSAEQN